MPLLFNSLSIFLFRGFSAVLPDTSPYVQLLGKCLSLIILSPLCTSQQVVLQFFPWSTEFSKTWVTRERIVRLQQKQLFIRGRETGEDEAGNLTAKVLSTAIHSTIVRHALTATGPAKFSLKVRCYFITGMGNKLANCNNLLCPYPLGSQWSVGRVDLYCCAQSMTPEAYCERVIIICDSTQ